MKGFVPAYEIRTPRNLKEALALLSREPGTWKPLAGGTDLMVLLEAGALEHRKLINLAQLKALKGIREESSAKAKGKARGNSKTIRIGALTPFSRIQEHPVLRREFPILCEAAGSIGAVAIQNRATIGGNIANASPAADSPPALLVYDAQVQLVSASGIRVLSYSEFHLGYKKLALRADELIHSVILPRGRRSKDGKWRHYFRKVGTRKAQAISKVSLAARLELAEGAIRDVRIALGSVAPTVIRCLKTEEVLRGARWRTEDRALLDRAKRILLEEIAPISDIRSTAEYRAVVAQNLLEDFLLGGAAECRRP